MLKRKWKTVELEEADMAEFSAMGGLEIDVLSDDSETVRSLLGKAAKDSVVKLKTKKKKPKKKTALVMTPSNLAVDLEENELISPELDMSKWMEYGLDSRILDGVRALGFSTPTPIQSAVIPKSLAGVDVLGAAQTGSGKTLAFGLPILHAILRKKTEAASIKALCILPTRELAVQVRDHLGAVVGPTLVSIGTVIGGMSVEKQFRVLSFRPDIVVGTPGRLAGLLGLSGKESESSQVCAHFKKDLCSDLSFFVLDEADRLLEQAHFRDLTAILAFVYQTLPSPDLLQSFIFSATLPVEGHELARLLSKLRLKPASQRFSVDLVSQQACSTEIQSVPKTLQFKCMQPSSDTDREPFLLYYLFQQFANPSRRVMVFVNAISYVYRLSSLLPLCLLGVKVVGIHSSLKQKDRLKKLDQFKQSGTGVRTLMIATDLAARGLDLPKVDAVVHLQPPRTPESLIHRSGRTARAGNAGECLMLVTPEQSGPWKKAIRLGLNRDVEEIEKIDVLSVDIRRVREIHRLANLLEGQTHKQRREAKDKAWSQRMCSEADLWDSDNEEVDEEEEENVPTDRHARTATVQDAADLEELLKAPLPSKLQR